MSVTDKATPAKTGFSRNTMLEAELVRLVRLRIDDPRRPLLEQHFGPSTDEEIAARTGAWFLRDAAYRCDRCEHVFGTGDVIYRRRVQEEPDFMSHWKLTAICGECVRRDMHPSWWKHRRAGVPCGGGCGALVSHWYPGQKITTCSRRCSKLATRVQHDDRTCEVCEETFTPKRKDARFCSSACRQDAYRQRKAGRL